MLLYVLESAQDLSKVKIKWPDTSVEDYEPDQAGNLVLERVYSQYWASEFQFQSASGAGWPGEQGVLANLRSLLQFVSVSFGRLRIQSRAPSFTRHSEQELDDI